MKRVKSQEIKGVAIEIDKEDHKKEKKENEM